MFGKNKEESPVKEILVTTTDEIPGKKYEIIGLVTAHTIPIKNTSTDYKVVQKEICKIATELNADAIVGFRATLIQERGLNGIAQSAYGTAVKFIE